MPVPSRRTAAAMLSALLVSVALSVLAGATDLFDRNLAYASPFTNAIHVSTNAFGGSVSHTYCPYLHSCHTTLAPCRGAMSSLSSGSRS